jgi:hypothetical protein
VARAPSPRHVRRASQRASAFLVSCQAESGAVLEPTPDPLGLLRGRASQREVFFASGGTDVWNTVNALLALRLAGGRLPGAAPFVLAHRLRDGSLSHSSLTRGPCVETTAAAALAMPRARAGFRRALRGQWLPDGRLRTFIIGSELGYDTYLTGPSVTAWALLSLGGEARSAGRLKRSVASLRADLAGAHSWAAHPAFYATRFYPAHVAVRAVPLPGLLVQALDLQATDGGWGFDGTPSRSSPLPTALALLTLAAFSKGAGVAHAQARGRRFLLACQDADGGFSLQGAPRELWYAGRVYVTCVALRALSGRPW